MNFLKSIFSPRRAEEPQSIAHEGTSTLDRKVDSTGKIDVGNTQRIHQTVPIDDLLDQEDGTEARFGHTIHKDSYFPEIPRAKFEYNDSRENSSICFQEIARALRHIRSGREWEHWCTKLFRSATDPCDKVRFAQFVSEKLQGARREEECYLFVHQCVNVFIVKSKILQLEEYISIFDSKIAREEKPGFRFTGEAPFFILRVLLMEAYHFQLLIRKLKVKASAQDVADETEVSADMEVRGSILNYTNPVISSLTGNERLQTLLTEHMAFSANYVEACEKKTAHLFGNSSEIQNLITQIRFLCCSNVFTLIQKLQYPTNGELCRLMLSISGVWEKGFLRHVLRMPLHKSTYEDEIKIMQRHTSFTPSTYLKAVNFTMTPDFTAKMVQAVFSTGLMYLNAYQQARASFQKSLHHEVYAYFKEVEFGFDTREFNQSRRHASLAGSIDERLWQLGKSLKVSSTPVFCSSIDVSCIQAAMANFEWLLRMRENGIISSQTGLFSSKTASFLFQVADFLHLDGMDAEALFLYSFVASFTEIDSETHRDSANRIFGAIVRHELHIKSLACKKVIAARELFPKTMDGSHVLCLLYKHQTEKITSGELVNSIKPFLAKFIPFLQDAEIRKNASSSSEKSVIISSTIEAHDICHACCVLGDVFLSREDPDYAIRFFLAAVRIVTSTSTLFSMRFFAMACIGISRATTNASLRRSIFESVDFILSGCIENRDSIRSQWMQQLYMASATMCTRLAIEVCTNSMPTVGQMCYTMNSSILHSGDISVLVPQHLQLCQKALRVSKYIRNHEIGKAISALKVESFCPFTPELLLKCIAHQGLTEMQRDTLLHCVSSHQCHSSCSAVDRGNVIYAVLDCFFTSHNEKVAKLLIENVGMSFNALNERSNESITSDPPNTVSVCCIAVDPVLKSLWIARADSFRSNRISLVDHTRYTLVRLPMKSEILDIIETLHNLIQKASNDIAFHGSKDTDTVQSRKYFWRQRKYFDNEVGLVLRRLGRVLGCWQAFFVGLSRVEHGNVYNFLHFHHQKILQILKKPKVSLPLGVLSEYALHVLLSYTVPIDCNEAIDSSHQESSLTVNDLSKIIQELVGVNSLSVEEQEELSTCVQELVHSWRHANIRSKEEPSDRTSSDSVHSPAAGYIVRRKVWLLMDQSMILKFPWEMMNMYQNSNSPVVRIPSLRFANTVCRSKEFSNAHKKFSDVGHRLTSMPSLFYCLNPSGDIESTQQRFSNLFQSIPDWSGVVGSYDCKKCVDGLKNKEVYLYIGHGSGEKCTPRHLLVDFTGPNTGNQKTHSFMTLLMGCSSCAIQNGPLSSPYTFLTAGNICFLGTLWDVTDGEIDRFTTSLICDALIPPEISLFTKNVQNSANNESSTACIRQLFPTDLTDEKGTSPSNQMKEIHLSVNSARYACKLPYLTGASVIMYGV